MKRLGLISLAIIATACSFEVYANVGVPLFTNFIAYSWLLLIPIIGIEAYVLKKRLPASLGRASAVSALSNIASTFVGTVTVFLAGIPFGLERSDAKGDISVLIALIPCFFLSVWIETLVGSPLLKQAKREDVRAVFVLANKFSYAMLAIVPVVRFGKNWVQGTIVW